MALTQIPLQPPPADHRPEQGDLFDAVTWESAYREMHDFPTLLIQTRDELARSRKREAFWISVVFHILLIVTVVNADKIAKYLPHRTVMLVNTAEDKKDLTFLELPSDLQKVTKPPKTNVTSDKTRIAESHAPKLDQRQLKELLDARRQGQRGPAAGQQPTPPQQQTAQAQPQQQQQPTQPAPQQTARLQSPPVQQKSPFEQRPMSAERSVYQAAQQVANNRGRFGKGDEGDMGLGQRQANARVGPYEILSDTMGVDFGPYLQRVLHEVRQNWYAVMPESANPPLLKRGRVSIEFAILRNGQVVGMTYVSASGDIALDRAAYGGISASNPFPPLPSEYAGQALRLRFTFFYNPEPGEANLH